MSLAIKSMLFGLSLITVSATAAWAGQETVLGYLEESVVYPGALRVKAKLDSGAASSSLHAESIEIVRRGGVRMVRFTTSNLDGAKLTLEHPLKGYVLIKRRNRQFQRRPVIVLGICLGKTYRETKVNLVNRGHFRYRLLVGRKYLAGHILIDSGATFTTAPRCPKVSGR